MHSERVDGYNPLAVIDAYKRKRKVLEENKGPVLLDVVTYRYVGHSTTDALHLPAPRKKSKPGRRRMRSRLIGSS